MLKTENKNHNGGAFEKHQVSPHFPLNLSPIKTIVFKKKQNFLKSIYQLAILVSTIFFEGSIINFKASNLK